MNTTKQALSFILIITLTITGVTFVNLGNTQVYADGTISNVVILDDLTTDVAITRTSDKTIAKEGSQTIAEAPNETGIVITGETTKYGITVDGTGSNGSLINVTLSDASIKLTENKHCTLSHENKAHSQIKLLGDNELISGSESPGLFVSSAQSTKIIGDGTLIAKGGSNAAGIGSGYRNSVGIISITDNVTITAQAVGQSAGIGNGLGGTTNSIVISGNAKVAASGGAYGAGIGSCDSGVVNSILITDNVEIIARGGKEAAGIGCGPNGKAGNIIISGKAKVDTSGGVDGAGIGNARYGNECSIEICDSANVIARGGQNASGIGGAYSCKTAKIMISDKANVTAVGGNHGSGIGSGRNDSIPIITISGGTINARGGENASGIGGGQSTNAGDLTIFNATVNATGGQYGAGIGGGNKGSSTNTKIYGNATVNATGGAYASGIGGGRDASLTNIKIFDDAKVAATGGEYASGIGGGYTGNLLDIDVLNNAKVTAIGGNRSAGIGGGNSGSSKNITISDSAVVIATGGTITPAIGAGNAGTSDNITINGGFVNAIAGPVDGQTQSPVSIGDKLSANSTNSKVYILGGSVFADKEIRNAVNKNGESLYPVYIPTKNQINHISLYDRNIKKIGTDGLSYRGRTVSSGTNCQHGSGFPSNTIAAIIYLPTGNYDDIQVGSFTGGKVNVAGQPSSYNDNLVKWERGSINNNTNNIVNLNYVYGDVQIEEHGDDVKAIEQNNDDGVLLASGKSIVFTGETEDFNVTLRCSEDIDVVLSDAAICFGNNIAKSPIKVENKGQIGMSKEVNIQVQGKNELKAGAYYAGINKGFDDVKLFINGTNGDSELDAKGGKYAAGIGGNSGENNSDLGKSNNIHISGNQGLKLKAVSDDSGAGIGAGRKGNAENITIESGCQVLAYGGNGASGIGGGYRGSAKNIEINDSYVTAIGNYHGSQWTGDGIGNGADSILTNNAVTINNSSVFTSETGIGTIPKNNNGRSLYEVRIPSTQNTTGKDLRGNKTLKITKDSETLYDIETVRSGKDNEHGDFFPDNLSAMVYLPIGDYEDIELGEQKNGFLNVVETPLNSFDNLLYWRQLAIESNNSVNLSKENMKTGETFGFTAKGDKENIAILNSGFGGTRYVPSKWKLDSGAENIFKTGQNTVDGINVTSDGQHVLTVVFDLEENDGTTWQKTSKTAIISKTFTSTGDSPSVTSEENSDKTTKIKFAQKSLYIKKGKSIKITPEQYTSDGSKSELIWKSSKSKVATVTQSGKIKAKKTGKAKITVSSKNGVKTSITVYVVKKAKKVKKVSFKIPSKIKLGSTRYLKATINPKKATSAKVTWSSSNKKIATVDKAGMITAKKTGKVKITLKAGGKKKTKVIYVK